MTDIEQRWRRLAKAEFVFRPYPFIPEGGWVWDVKPVRGPWETSRGGVAPTLDAALTAAEEYAAEKWGFKP